jgi:hypothetical protein
MQHRLKWAVISVVLASSLCSAAAQNRPTPKSEDAEKNAFETPTTGRNTSGSSENAQDRAKELNPESRQNDNPPPREKVGAPNASPK